MTIPQEGFEADLIIDGSDDWVGLYEVIWLANTRYPKESLSFKYDLAEKSIRSLLKKGRIVLVKRSSPWALADSSEEGQIPPEEWDEVISNPCSWYPCNSDNMVISYLTTELGQQAMERRPR